MVRRKPRRKPLGTIWEISDELGSRNRPGGPRGLLPQGSRGSVRALSGIRLVIS